ncbi:MAG: hypothetical protein R2824_02170 [Saprospiraceae bacterium]|nr:hypothetical protein [Lewinella sp.]
MSRKKASCGEELLQKISAAKAKRIEIQRQGQRDREPNLMQLSHALDEYYILEKLRTYCSYLSYRLMVNDALIGYEKQDFRLLPYILEIVHQETNWHPAVKIFYQLSQLLDIPSTEQQSFAGKQTTFTSIEKLLDQYYSVLSSDDLTEIHSHLTNYSTYQLNNGRYEFLSKNIMHNQRVITLQEQEGEAFEISAGVYTNLVRLILKTAQGNNTDPDGRPIVGQDTEVFNRAHQFADRYQDKLPGAVREKYYAYGKALIYFRSGNYEAAFQWIKDLDRIRELFINFDIKVLRLQLLLEMDIIDDRRLEREGMIMEDEIESLRSMLKYDKYNSPKLAYQSEYFQEFLNLFRKLYHFYNKHAWMFRFGDAVYHHQRKVLLAEMLACRYPYQQWFLAKLEAIK